MVLIFNVVVFHVSLGSAYGFSSQNHQEHTPTNHPKKKKH